MANEEHLQIIRKGVDAWNEWRAKNPELLHPDLSGAYLWSNNLTKVNLSGAILTEAYLSRAKLTDADLSKANLRMANLEDASLEGAKLGEAYLANANLCCANLSGAYLYGAYLYGAYLEEAILSNANLMNANLSGANLNRANLMRAILARVDLSRAHLTRADLTGASLTGAYLFEANLEGSNLEGADLVAAQLIKTDLSNATLKGSDVHGVSVWNIKVNEHTKQQNLIITDPNRCEPIITVDNIEVAQFIYLLLNNQKLRDVIDTITSKAVLILGRFSKERKRVLDAIRDELRKPEHNYLPIVFDFQPSANQTPIETITTLARMARFVIADLTDARSVLQELEAIVPDLPSLAVRLMIKKSAHEYGMLGKIRKYPWVIKGTYKYENAEEVIASIKKNVIEPAEAMVKELRQTN